MFECVVVNQKENGGALMLHPPNAAMVRFPEMFQQEQWNKKSDSDVKHKS